MNEHEISRTQHNGAPVEIRTKGLSPDAVTMFQRIESRANELFESNGKIHGHDLENWVRAESELFPPAPIQVTESEDQLKLEVDVRGFAPKELEVDLEPQRITVIGKHHTQESHKTGGEKVTDERSTHLLRCVGLPTRVDTSNADARVNRGVLQVELKKAPVV
jgi:HSP20 family molecular chaperone IbpA